MICMVLALVSCLLLFKRESERQAKGVKKEMMLLIAHKQQGEPK